MWLGPLHDQGFVGDLLENLEVEKERYGTYARMKGMLTTARDVGHSSLVALVIAEDLIFTI